MSEVLSTPGDTVSDKLDDAKSGYCYWKKIRGTDPSGATCRSKLQFQRAKLNQRINYETMMRNGAEKLYRATANKKLKENVALELKFANSGLQLLKEQLADLNSSVQLYQNKSHCAVMPMLPLGLKETKEIDFKETFKDFILEHYSEDDNKYDSAIQQLNQIRQAVRTPSRDQAGVKLLLQYYSLLYYIDKRFFPPHRSMGLYFEWFDSLTGLPSMEKCVGFERVCILYNVAALYTQIGTKQDRTKSAGTDAAVDSFLRAAGIFHYIKARFSNSSSADMSPEVLEMFTQLMLAQARECLLIKLISEVQRNRIIQCLDVAQEAAQMVEVYSQLLQYLNCPVINANVPTSWAGLIQVKREHYAALSHHFVAVGLATHNGDLNEAVEEKLEFLHIEERCDRHEVTNVPKNMNERLRLAKAHIHEAILHHEEGLRWYRMCRKLQIIDGLHDILRETLCSSTELLGSLNSEIDQYQENLEVKAVRASTKYQLKLADPDFNQYQMADLFKGLGPLKFFSAKRHWTAARIVELKKTDEQASFGFSLKDDAPVVVTRVEVGSVAEACGLKDGDYITAVNNTDAKWMLHEEMAQMIKSGGNCITLKLVTPMDWKYLHSKRIGLSVCSKSTTSSSSGVSSTSSRNPSPIGSISNKSSGKRHSWNIFRKKNSKDPLQSSYLNNIQYR